MLDALCGSSWFSVLDHGKAYHQGFLDEESQPLTALITPWGLYEWDCIPFGLSSAPRRISEEHGTLFSWPKRHNFLLYLDDSLVDSSSFEQHVGHVHLVLHCYKEHGIKLIPKKCELFSFLASFLENWWSFYR